MKKSFEVILWISMSVLAAACSGGGGATAPSAAYTVGGTVTGITASGLVLQNNGGDDLNITADGAFTFRTPVADGAAYSVTVKTQPGGQFCSVAGGGGAIAGANISTVVVTCTNLAVGILDTTFGTNIDGKVQTKIGALEACVRGLAIQSDGKIVAAGYSSDDGIQYVFALARYNTDGTLDATFATKGTVTTAIGSTDDKAYAVALQPDGKIVAAGYSTVAGQKVFALARYNTDGTLDTSFDGDGIVTNTGSGRIYALAIQSDGKIIAAGGGTVGFELARYNTDGSLDTSFDGDGIVTTAINGGAYAVAIQPDGRIVAAGDDWANVPTYSSVAVARYNTDGSPDTGFGANGTVATAFGTADAWANAIALQQDGKIVAGGYGDAGGGVPGSALLRYNTNGSLDTSFDGDGISTTDSWGQGIEALAIQADGKVVAAGAEYVGYYLFALARHNTDGSLDTSFGTDGVVTTNVSSNSSSSDSEAYAVAIQPDGKIVAAGSGNMSGGGGFMLARYE